MWIEEAVAHTALEAPDIVAKEPEQMAAVAAEDTSFLKGWRTAEPDMMGRIPWSTGSFGATLESGEGRRSTWVVGIGSKKAVVRFGVIVVVAR